MTLRSSGASLFNCDGIPLKRTGIHLVLKLRPIQSVRFRVRIIKETFETVFRNIINTHLTNRTGLFYNKSFPAQFVPSSLLLFAFVDGDILFMFRMSRVFRLEPDRGSAGRETSCLHY